jgi:hypothetical protein
VEGINKKPSKLLMSVMGNFKSPGTAGMVLVL